jgi:hypothetical protein
MKKIVSMNIFNVFLQDNSSDISNSYVGKNKYDVQYASFFIVKKIIRH